MCPHVGTAPLRWGRFRGTVSVEVIAVVSSRGGKYGFVYKSRQNVYRALRRKGFSKSKAARISNGGHYHAQRVVMARKGAAKRRAKRR